jgi:16S rRNA (cytidine1402-2'-O)-methyltransferase
MNSIGILYIVATPIGNLDDISLRVKTTLSKVDLIAAEDTRVTQKLLNHLGIKKKSISYHQYNEEQKSKYFLTQLLAGQDIALVSDAGTPAISDPGYEVIRLAHENNIKVIGIPGPSAIILALSMSGLAVNSFIFDSFFPRTTKSREEKIQELISTDKTYVFFESVHRILSTLSFLYDHLDKNRNFFIGRELTKKFEQYYKGDIEGIKELISSPTFVEKGEFVLIIDKPIHQALQLGRTERLFDYIDLKKINKSSIKELSNILNVPKNEIYRAYLKKAGKV